MDMLQRYGAPKLARYFVRSLDDLLDVNETVLKRVLQGVDVADVEAVMKSIAFIPVQVPNTLTSLILGFQIPCLILDPVKRTRSVRSPMNPPPIDDSIKPRVCHRVNSTVIVAEIANFFDLYVLHRLLRNLMQCRIDGPKLIAAKRHIQMTIAKRQDGQPGFEFAIAFHNVIFGEAALDEPQKIMTDESAATVAESDASTETPTAI